MYKPTKVHKGCNLEQLKELVFKDTKVKFEEFNINLVYNWSNDFGSKAIKIVDNDKVELMFCAVSKSLELYVGKLEGCQ